MDDKAHKGLRFTLFAPYLATAWVLILARDAHAYIDPGAGSMLVQLLLAGTAGVAVLGKLFWLRIRRALGMAPPDADTPSMENRPTGHDRV
jgi:hypothetical protein